MHYQVLFLTVISFLLSIYTFYFSLELGFHVGVTKIEDRICFKLSTLY